MNPILDSTPTADESLQLMKAGNARFVAGTPQFLTVQKEILADLAKSQRPYATILSCGDSRVPELIFDSGLARCLLSASRAMSWGHRSWEPSSTLPRTYTLRSSSCWDTRAVAR